MEKFKDETRNIFKKVDICPRCQNHLEPDIKRNKIECPKCGFFIKLDSKYNVLSEWLIITCAYFVLFGVITIGVLIL